MQSTLRSLVTIGAIWTLTIAGARGGARSFTYVYEATTAPKGSLEYEQWVTWKTDKQSDADFERFDFRHEIEYGVTDRLQLGLYLADWRYEENAADSGSAKYRTSAIEAIYNLTNPYESLLGSALYGEVKVGDDLYELEGKVLLQKDIGPWLLAYNAIVEAEWEDNFDEKKGEWANSAGLSYMLDARLMVGVEALHEVEIEDWSDFEDHAFYVGPNASLRFRDAFVTVTGLFQATDLEGEPNIQTRLIAGVDL